MRPAAGAGGEPRLRELSVSPSPYATWRRCSGVEESRCSAVGHNATYVHDIKIEEDVNDQNQNRM